MEIKEQEKPSGNRHWIKIKSLIIKTWDGKETEKLSGKGNKDKS